MFAITTYINYNQWNLARKNSDYFATSTENVRVTNRFQKNILYMDFGLRGYLMTGDKYFLITYDSAKVENTQIMAELANLLAANPLQLQKFRNIAKYYNQWVHNFAEPLRSAKLSNSLSDNTVNAAYKNDTALRRQEKINIILRNQFKDLLNIEYDNRVKAKEVLEKSVKETNYITSALALLSVIIGLLIAIALARHVSRQMVKMATVQNTVADATYSGIKNLLPMLFEGGSELSPRVKEHLESIKARIHKSHMLMEGILTYAGLGKELQAKEEVNINDLVNNIVREQNARPGLRIDVDPGLPTLHTERNALTQIFSNIIGNAIRYHNKPLGTIKVYSKDNGTSYEFFVEDDGPGIDASYQEIIFDLVQTAQNASGLDNTGIGLLIVKKILDTRKEQIRLSSEPGKGAVFSFTWTKADPQQKNKNKHPQPLA